jgi:hypothetical protein
VWQVRVGDVFDYPYREVWPMFHQLAEHVGCDQLHWGTDMPFQNRFCTYKQSRSYLERCLPAPSSPPPLRFPPGRSRLLRRRGGRHCCAGLRDEDLAMVMGGTAARLLRLPAPGEADAPGADGSRL